MLAEDEIWLVRLINRSCSKTLGITILCGSGFGLMIEIGHITGTKRLKVSFSDLTLVQYVPSCRFSYHRFYNNRKAVDI